MSTDLPTAASLENPEGQPFWVAAREGRFVLPQCDGCGRFHWYPRAVCPFCLSTSVRWKESRGLGRIYASTLFRRADKPVVIAYVELDEGPRLLTSIRARDDQAVAIGQRVEVVLVDSTSDAARPYPVFQPIEA